MSKSTNIQSLAPAIVTVSIKDIASVRTAILDNKVAMHALTVKAEKPLRLTIEAFLNYSGLDQKLADAISKLSGDLISQSAISKLSFKIPTYRLPQPLTAYKVEEGKLGLASTLLNVLGDLRVIKSVTGQKSSFEDGIKVFRNVTTYHLGDEVKTDILRGLHNEPAQIVSHQISVKPGGKSMKLNAEQKDFVRSLSSAPLRLVRIDAEYLRSYYMQTKWYKNALAKKLEDKILLKARIDRYIEIVSELQEHTEIYLSNWFDFRLRMYYDLTMLGINPQGDAFETHMWELSKPVVLKPNGFEAMRHAAVTIATGKRHSRVNTEKLWDSNSVAYLATIVDVKHYQDDGGRWDKGGFGEHFYGVRLAQAIADYHAGKPSYFMMGEDATTGGLQHAGAGFKSVKSMKASNIGGLKNPMDAHKLLGDSFGLSRSTAKGINTPLLHGSSWSTIARELTNVTGDKISVPEVIEHAVDAYGPEIENVPMIAEWGSNMYDNSNTTLLFTALDGWKCQSTNYIQSAQVTVYGLSLHTKSGYSTTILTRDMPLHVSLKGEVIPVKGEQKSRGLYANITHSIDGWNLRSVATMLRSLDRSALFKHDKFYTSPNDMNIINRNYIHNIGTEFASQTYHRAMTEIAHNMIGATPDLPTLLEGDGTADMIATSDGYLAS